MRVVNRSGIGMNGAAPLSYATLAHMSALTETAFQRWEIDALFRADAILRGVTVKAD